jgi:excisionase family DNA binding protein
VKIYTIAEVATELSVDRKTVYKLIDSGRLRATHISPRARRVSENSLREFMEYDGSQRCDRSGCSNHATKMLGLANGESGETFACELHWALDYKGRIGPNISVTDIDHQQDAKEVSK